ncbi:MAG: protein kinase family protein [Eubacteriales bacterium]|nr:protein kinase family protein [Eubacteriales bacterium]
MKQGDIIHFIKGKDYIVLNDDLGQGSFGKTVLLKDPYIDELFVAKKYEPEYPDLKERFFDSFLQEIRIMYKLNNPNIVRIFNYYAYPEYFTGYILMEYIEGMTIDKFFSIYIPGLIDPDTNSVFIQLINAFQYLESCSVIHRDIREGNIMIDNYGNVKVIDFGLGKVFSSKSRVDDSMNSEVNRLGIDKLPNEYYDGEYTSQTDMFYLAELYNRILNSYNLKSEFMYNQVLEKMLKEDKNERYKSFNEIVSEISRQDFAILEFSEKDKRIYQDFAEGIYGCIVECIGERFFVEDHAIFQQRLAELLKNNLLENSVQNLVDLIHAIILSKCRYHKSKIVDIKVVDSFYKWFRQLSETSKKLVFSNLIYKLSTIKVTIEAEIPF